MLEPARLLKNQEGLQDRHLTGAGQKVLEESGPGGLGLLRAIVANSDCSASRILQYLLPDLKLKPIEQPDDCLRQIVLCAQKFKDRSERLASEHLLWGLLQINGPGRDLLDLTSADLLPAMAQWTGAEALHDLESTRAGHDGEDRLNYQRREALLS